MPGPRNQLYATTAPWGKGGECALDREIVSHAGVGDELGRDTGGDGLELAGDPLNCFTNAPASEWYPDCQV